MAGRLWITESITWVVGGDTEEEAWQEWAKYQGGIRADYLDMKMKSTDCDSRDDALWEER